MSYAFDPDDYSMVVKNRAKLPAPWRWEIYRAGRTSPIAHSSGYFESRGAASSEGKAALEALLEKLNPKSAAPGAYFAAIASSK